MCDSSFASEILSAPSDADLEGKAAAALVRALRNLPPDARTAPITALGPDYPQIGERRLQEALAVNGIIQASLEAGPTEPIPEFYPW